jgi:hypothetical protein
MFRLLPRNTSARKISRAKRALIVEVLEDRTLPSTTISSFTVPFSANEAESVALSAQAIDDSGSSPLTYSWDFGDGHAQSGSNLTDVNHAFAANIAGGGSHTPLLLRSPVAPILLPKAVKSSFWISRQRSPQATCSKFSPGQLSLFPAK